jgi:hypothetical protein
VSSISRSRSVKDQPSSHMACCGAGGARTHDPGIMRPAGRVSAVICHDRRRASVMASASPWSAGVRQDLRGCYAFVPTQCPPQFAKACCASVVPAALPLGSRSRCQQPARPGRIRETGVKPGSDRSAGMIADPDRRAPASGAPTGPVPASGVRSLNSDRDVIRRYGATALDLIADLLA